MSGKDDMSIVSLLARSKKRIKVLKSLEKEDKIPSKITDKNLILNGGEDYSLVICMDKRDFLKFPELVQIGLCSEGSGVYIDSVKTEFEGYKHFE